MDINRNKGTFESSFFGSEILFEGDKFLSNIVLELGYPLVLIKQTNV
jgi:hypothetical protein